MKHAKSEAGIQPLHLTKHVGANTPIIANKNSKPGIGVVVDVELGEGV